MLALALGVIANAQTEKRKSSPEKIISKYDSDNDGQLSKAEIENSKRSGLIGGFAKIDIDNDGYLSINEVSTMMTKIKERKNKRHLHKQNRNRKMLAKLDTDHDQMISKEEAEKALVKHFDKLDTNKDNLISSDEFKAFKAKMKEKRLERKM